MIEKSCFSNKYFGLIIFITFESYLRIFILIMPLAFKFVLKWFQKNKNIKIIKDFPIIMFYQGGKLLSHFMRFTDNTIECAFGNYDLFMNSIIDEMHRMSANQLFVLRK